MALIERATGDHVAGADVHDVRVGRGHLDGTDGRRFAHRVEHRRPLLTTAGGLPQAATGIPGVVDARVSDRTGDGAHASGTERPEIAP